MDVLLLRLTFFHTYKKMFSLCFSILYATHRSTSHSYSVLSTFCIFILNFTGDFLHLIFLATLFAILIRSLVKEKISKQLNNGLPQGSVLAPLLFNLTCQIQPAASSALQTI